jgi:TetR/AcrR family transcriptional regulator, tetracycline repressor protein
MPKRSTTTERRRATRDDIARTALRLADREGLAAVTMRRLGAELGVDPVIVYRHFEGKDEVLDAAADLVLAEVNPPQDAPDWRENVRRGCHALRAALLAHPAVAPIVLKRPPNGANQFDATERMIAALRAAGLDDASAAKAYHALVLFTLGSSYLETELAQLSDDERAERSRAARLMYESLPAQRYPSSTAVAEHLFGSTEGNYEFGLTAMLDGLDARARAARQRSD